MNEGSRDPLAIIGLACRFPQDASNLDNLWELLLSGRSATTKIPQSRMNGDGHYHPDPERGGAIYTRHGHFLAEDTTAFDAPFFKMSKEDARAIDPQQRLVLENVYHALENAGLPIGSISGSMTSVFVAGGFMQDYANMLNLDPEIILKKKPMGTTGSILANRISWFYDLQGTSMTVDTACSSSITALHQARISILAGESDMAIVSGVNTMDFPGTFTTLGSMTLLSPEGKCYSFDHRANGYGRGEGVGSLIIKSLSAALRDGNTIRALIRATGLNQDGRTPGITYPNEAAQEALIRQVYAKAGLDVRYTDYVEAHGTGTRVGDPIEASAIASAFKTRARERPLYIGSIKSNIGHLEPAAGVAGVIKAVLMLETGVIPSAANFEKAHPNIALDDWNIRIATDRTGWPSRGIRRISVNSFGFGGSNGHVVLDDAYHFLQERQLVAGIHNTKGNLDENKAVSSNDIPPSQLCNGDQEDLAAQRERLFVLSAFDESGIKRTSAQLSQYLQAAAEKKQRATCKEAQDLADLAFTLTSRRTTFSWKAFCVAKSRAELADWLQGQAPVLKPLQPSRDARRLAFVFTGQGAQWPAMGQALRVYPIYRQRMEEASRYMKTLGSPWDLDDEISKDKVQSQINDPFLSQAACTALQVALIDLLASWNITPSRVVGHSSGEIAAAYSVKLITRNDAWKLAYFRGLLSAEQLERKGAMMAVGLSSEAIQPYLQGVREQADPGELIVACFNSPQNITVSGDEALINMLHARLEHDNIFARKLAVKNAYHSSHMEAVARSYSSAIGNLDQLIKEPAPCPMYSSVTTRELDPEEAQNAEYWVRNLVSPVRFADAFLAMVLSSTKNTAKGSFLSNEIAGVGTVNEVFEIGPHAALRTAIRETISSKGQNIAVEYSNMLNRNDPSAKPALTTIGSLYGRGYPVNLEAVNGESSLSKATPKMLTDFPPYEFNHSRTYWTESRLSTNFRFRAFPRHDLCGAPVSDWNLEEPRWRGFLRASELPWIKDHTIDKNWVYPGAGYIVMALEASKQISDSHQVIHGFKLQDISLKAALVVPDTSDGIEFMLSMRKSAESTFDKSQRWRDFNVSSYHHDSRQWTEHCTGRICLEYHGPPSELDSGREDSEENLSDSNSMEDAEAICRYPLPIYEPYDFWDNKGLSYGPSFRTISNSRLGDGHGHSLNTITIPDIAACMPKNYAHPHTIQPATLDGVFATFMISRLASTMFDNPELPMFIKEVWIAASVPKQPGYQFECYTQTKHISSTNFKSSMLLWDSGTQEAKIRIDGFETKPLISSTRATGDAICHYIEVQPDVNLLDEHPSVFLQLLQSPSDEEVRITSLKRYQLLSILFIFKALDALEGTDVKALSSHLQKYVEWSRFLRQRVCDRSLVHCEYERLQELLGDDDKYHQFLHDTNVSDASEQLLLRVGPRIISVLKGEVDPLEIIFAGDDLIDRFYSSASTPLDLPALLDSYLKALAHNMTNLKVLEIGAGTGSATARVLKALSPRSSDGKGPMSLRITTYTYTDVSVGFFENAKTKFSDWGNLMEFKKLNIEENLQSQGFEFCTFDIVIASNVLHATADLVKSLNNVRSLLRSGGKLIMLENIQPDHLMGPTCFGLLPGWWLSREAFRPYGPLTSEENWESLLAASGFSGADVVLRDSESEAAHQMSVFASTAMEIHPALSSEHYSKPVRIICANQSQMEQDVATVLGMKLRESGYLDCASLDYHNLSSVSLADTLCIVLLGFGDFDLSELDKNEFMNVQRLLSTASWLLWISSDQLDDPKSGMATGLIRTVRWERDYDEPNLVLLDVDKPIPEPAVLANKIITLLRRHFEGTPVLARNGEYILRDCAFCTARVVESDAPASYMQRNEDTVTTQTFGADKSRSLKLTSLSPGLLDRLVFKNDPIWELPLDENEVEVKIEATSLNFRDVMVATGQLADIEFGIDVSGVITRLGDKVNGFHVGDRVIAMTPGSSSSAYATFCRVTEEYVIAIPPEMTFDDAATIPVLYITALHGLNYVGRITSGESILIHSAAGGTGQAAIQIAELAGAEIYATVSTAEKKTLLMEHYGIPEDHIFFSRDLTFAKGIKRMTKGKGVDIILNSLPGEALRLSWECIAPFGRFIELGRKDIDANGKLQMSPFTQNALYFALDTKDLIARAPRRAASHVRQAIDLHMQGKIHTPRPLSTYGYGEIENVFRQVASGKGMGKIVLKPQEDDLVPVLSAEYIPHRFSAGSSYVLSGGLGGLGRSLARWMVSRGARHLIFLSRSGAASQAAQELLSQLDRASCQFKVCQCDVANREQLSDVLRECGHPMPPIRGCIQAAMVLDDSMFVNMSHDKFQAAVAPKVKGTQNLHSIFGEKLDFFIMLSSITSIVGYRGQANYASGNSFQDAFAKHLVQRGFNAASINLGSIQSVGYVAEQIDSIRKQKEAFFQWDDIPESQMHRLVEYHINPKNRLNGPEKCQTITRLRTAAQTTRRGLPLPAYMNYPLFAHLHADNATTGPQKEELFPIEKLLRQASSRAAAALVVAEALQRKLSGMMSIPKEEIDLQKPLLDYAVDSLVAVEIRTWIGRTMSADVSVLDILSRMSILEFGRKVAEGSALVEVGDGLDKDAS